MLDERKKLERDLADARKKLAMGGGGKSGADDAIKNVGSVKLFARAVEGIEMKDLKSLVDEGKKSLGSGVIAYVGVEDGKAALDERSTVVKELRGPVAMAQGPGSLMCFKITLATSVTPPENYFRFVGWPSWKMTAC